MESIDRKFKESDKAETKNLMSRLANTKYEEGGNVREHIMGLVDVAAKLNKLKVPIDSTYLVHIELDSLPYKQMKSMYNTLKEDWTMDDLMLIDVLEENRTKADKSGGLVNWSLQRSMRIREVLPTKKWRNRIIFQRVTTSMA